MKTPEDNIKYWLDVIVNTEHPHRRKFSKSGKFAFTDSQIEDYCNRMIALNEKDLEIKTKAA